MSRLLVLLCTAVLLAGCGGDGEAVPEDGDYEQRLEEALGNVRSSLDDLRGARSPDGVAEGLRRSADAAREAADDLDDADPPQDAEDANARLVAALRSLGDELERGAGAAEEGSLTELLDVARNAGTETAGELEDALRDLEEQGVDVPDLRLP